MTEHSLFYYPYASFTNAQLPLFKVAAMYFDIVVILDLVCVSWAIIGADYHARDAVRQLQDAGILQKVTQADVLVKYAGPITVSIRWDMHALGFRLCRSLHVGA
jgi:hypothetical protein